MTVREFSAAANDDLQTAVGGLAAMTHGTIAIIVQRRGVSDFATMFCLHNSGGSGSGEFIFWDDDDAVWWVSGSGNFWGSSITADTWYLIVWRKDNTAFPVSAVGRFSVYNYATDTWTHGGSNSQANNAAPGADGTVRFSANGGQFLNGRVAARAAWSNTLPWSADAAGDAQIEAAGLDTAATNWVAANPDAGWLFNTTPVEDFTGNGADQTAISGTTVVTDDDPPGFDFGLGADERTGSAASTAPAGTAAGTGTVTVTGSAASTSPPAVAATAGAVTVSGTASASTTAAEATGGGTVVVTGTAASVAPAAVAVATGPQDLAVDLALSIGPTRARAQAAAAATRARPLVGAGATRTGWATGDTRGRPLASAGDTRGRPPAAAGNTRVSWAAGDTRTGWQVGDTRTDRED